MMSTTEAKRKKPGQPVRNFSVLNKTKDELPGLPFGVIKEGVLGRDYALSLVFVEDGESRGLNRKYRDKNYIPNVLSFELDKTAGEIFINPAEARRQARDSGRTPTDFVGYLFIHAMLHLKGMRHGGTMDKLEAKFCKKFGL